MADHLPSPCLYGIAKPAVYLTPDSLADERRTAFVLAHELTHYRHRDYLWALIRIFCLCIHWFNPLVWLAAVLSRRDSELACDEGTVRKLGNENRVEYGRMIIEMSTAPTKPSQLFCCATTMTGGKEEMTERIRRIARQPKTLLATLAAVVIVTVAAVALTFGSAANISGSKPDEVQDLNTQELWNARTSYVGDNSAVGRLLGLLPLPEGLHHDHFELLTSGNERGVTWVLKEDGDSHTSVSPGQFQKNALLLFALVDNLQDFYAALDSSPDSGPFCHYTRQQAEELVGGDLRDYAKSPETLQELIRFTADPWLENSYTEGIPRPDFDNLLWMTPADEKGYCAVCYQDVSREQMEAYLQTLAADGWQTIRDFYEDTTVGGLYEKGSHMISIQFAGQQVVLYFSLAGT
ncbi:DUF4825 domain-containing protein [Lachnospiraceae bacterium ASD4241]|uniref:DUF4825 domain-containing protein n=2 Tax=Diplocloster modestus TaxID=2850322 RepID=A0ABS6K8A2_9FIRM|nr:DUF4825 domain-containing protein [Diplocloster modestus]